MACCACIPSPLWRMRNIAAASWCAAPRECRSKKIQVRSGECVWQQETSGSICQSKDCWVVVRDMIGPICGHFKFSQIPDYANKSMRTGVSK